MKRKKNRLLSAFLSFLMVFSMLANVPFVAFAAETTEILNTYETVESTLAPGVTQSINYAYRDDGQFVKYYVAVADLNNPNVGLHATYGGAQCTTPGVTKMTEQVASMTTLHSNPEDTNNYIPNYAIVAGVNGDGYNTTTGKPSGAHVMNGISGFGITKSGNSPWFAIFEDGTAACGRANFDWDEAVEEHGAVKEAIGGFQLLMKDGVIWEPSSNASDMTKGGSNYWRPGFNYPCSFLGVTYDNKVVLLNCDGNNAGGSAGFTYDYTLEVAAELGLKDLLCLDGGGSATYLSRQPGDEQATVISNPSDGSERAVANGMVVYTTVPPSNVFDRAILETSDTRYTPYSEVAVNAIGISPAGTTTDIPEDVEWALSDDSFGTIANGVFTSNGKIGAVELQMIYKNAVVGKTEVQIVNPTLVAFTQDSMVVPLGKSASVKIEAFYHDTEHDVTLPVTIKASDFTFTFSDTDAGKMNGFTLIAPDEDKTKVTLTADYKHADLDSFSIEVTYGKGSEIIWDFEDGDVSKWMGTTQVDKWVKENNMTDKSPFSAAVEFSGSHENDSATGKYLYNADGTPKFKMYAGNGPQTNRSYTFLATADNGQVKNGNYALGFTLDETSYNEYGSWEYNILFNVGGQTVLRDVANGLNATTLGMWVYLPEDLVGVRYTGDQASFAMQYQLYGGTSAETVKGIGGHFIMQDTGKNLYSASDSSYTETGRWVYMTADISGYDYVSLQNPYGGKFREPSFIRFYFKKLEANKYTFYYDDITLDYSSAVEDRDAPIISAPKYSVVDSARDFSTVCTLNDVMFTANIADFAANNSSGLDYSSAKIYVDGVVLDNVSASGNTMFSEEVTLTSGTHEVIFEIADNMGTITQNVEMLTISGTEPVWIDGHNDSGELAEYDSIYYMDLKVADASKISKIVTEISVNHANAWQLPYLTVADGFSVDYEFIELTNSIKMTVTKDADCMLTGEQTLVSIPVRTWSWPDGIYSYAEKTNVSTKTQSTKGGRPFAPIDFEVEYGMVTYISGNYDGYIGAFYDYFTTETKIQDEKYAWHYTHTVNAIADQPASCTEEGYKGRTYCDVCKTVVDWGTIIEATGHSFAVADGVLKCTCGECYNGVYSDGKTYIEGVIATGWIDDSYWVDGLKLTGVQLVEGFYYNFGEDGVCDGKTKYTGLFYDKSVEAYRYSKFGELYGGWAQVGGNWHYFWKYNFKAATGEVTLAANGVTYQFDETGMTKGAWHTTEAGTRYYYCDDYYRARQEGYQSFFEIDGKTYNFSENGYVTYGQYRALQPGAFIMQREVFEFNEDGSLKGKYTEPGTVLCADGYLYLIHEDGIAYMNCGLVEYNGAYYDVKWSGKLAMNEYRDITVENSNGLEIELGKYYFGSDGKMVIPEPPFTGIREAEDGYYYYVNDKVYKGHPGLIEMDGAYYDVKWSGKIAVNEYRDITVENSNGLEVEPGKYYFGSDGKMVIPEPPFTGIREAEDGYYYYVNDKVYKGHPGLIEIDGAYYDVKWSGKIAMNEYRDITAENSNGLEVEPGKYYFGLDGKMVIPEPPFTGIKEAEDGYYYYVNDKIYKGHPGLIEIDGAYYDVKWSGKIAMNEYRDITVENSNGLEVEPGKYYFGSDGKMVIPEPPFTGIKEAEDGYYYYVNDKVYKGHPGLIEMDGAYYDVKWSGKIAVNEYRDITVENSNGLEVEPGKYYFGSDGKMVYPDMMITIIDDDGYEKFYDLLLPIVKEKNVTISSAIPTGYLNDEVPSVIGKTMSWEQVLECHESGVEILSHTHMHLTSEKVSNMSYEDILSDYTMSQNMLEEHGITSEAIVFAGGSSQNENCISAAQELFSYGFKASGNKINMYGLFEPYKINRYVIEPEECGELNTLVDELIQKGTGWMVWMIHTSDSAFQQEQADQIAAVIDYAIENGVRIVSTKEAIEAYVTQK